MQPMKPERKHLASGDKRRGRSIRAQFQAMTAGSAIAATAAVAAVVVGSSIALPAALASVVAAGLAGAKFRELKTWGVPEVTVATIDSGGSMLPLVDGDKIGLGTTMVGNYRRQSHVQPVPESALTGWLIAVERTSRGAGKNKKNYAETVHQIPLSIKPNVNDGWLDVDFSVEIPVVDAPVSMHLGRNKVKWYVELRLSTKGPDDRQTIDLIVGGVVNPTYYSLAAP